MDDIVNYRIQPFLTDQEFSKDYLYVQKIMYYSILELQNQNTAS